MSFLIRVFTEEKTAVFSNYVYLLCLAELCADWPESASCLAGSVHESTSGVQGSNGLDKHYVIWLITGGSVVEEKMRMGRTKEELELIMSVRRINKSNI